MPELDINKIILLAETNFRNQRRRFGIKKDDRRRHMYLIGKTGMGKTTVIENMIIQDIRAGEGVALVDPHGDIADKIIDYIPPNRINDVIYFNPADIDFPIAFNVLEKVDASHRHLISSGLVGVFKKIWADSWGPRLEYVLRNAILALLEYPGSSLLGIMRILVDKAYRKRVISKITDPVVKSFWVEEYSKYPDRFQAEAIAPIQNKVGQFLSTFLIRNIVGQVKSKIDMREAMDTKKIVIMNLAKGRVGEDASALLGAMMITKVQLAAMSRVDIPENERVDFYLYVDEFQNFATESFANILSEARKYRLNLIIAHQYIEQLEENVQAAVFGNVGTIMCFRVGAFDAVELVKEFEPQFTEIDLVNLAKYDVYMKLMIDGVSSAPFSASTLPPLTQEIQEGNREKIIRISRERYAEPREMVEEKIVRWSGIINEEERVLTKEGQVPPKRKESSFSRKGEEREEGVERDDDKSPFKFETLCSYCQRKAKLSFNPDPLKPVYCKECLKKLRAGDPNLDRFDRDFIKKIKLEAVAKEVPKEISLKEAIEQGRQQFGERGNQRKSGRQRSNENNVNKVDRVNGFGHSAPSSWPRGKLTTSKVNKAGDKDSDRDLKPGEMVELD